MSGAASGRAPKPTPVAVGLGSNLGDRGAHLAAGVEGLAGLLEDLRCSRVYETEPVGVGEQADFLNMCCVGRTVEDVRSVLESLLALERAEGRAREGPGPSPRTLDADLLLYGAATVDEPDLCVPHPRMAGRGFVLVPLAEIAGGWRVPPDGRTVAELAERVEAGGVEPFDGELPEALRRRMGS